MGRIVVAVDGSPGSTHALAWALDEAQLRGDALDAVLAFSTFALDWSPVPGVMYLPETSPDALHEDAVQRLDDAVNGVLRGRTPDIEVNRIVVQGPVVRSLLEAAKGADMLVTGSRGYGGFRGLLLGSVSHQLVTHAPCPVVVVRGDEDEEA